MISASKLQNCRFMNGVSIFEKKISVTMILNAFLSAEPTQ